MATGLPTELDLEEPQRLAATVAEMEAKRNREFKQLDRQLEDGDMAQAVYLKKKREIEDRYSVQSAH